MPMDKQLIHESDVQFSNRLSNRMNWMKVFVLLLPLLTVTAASPFFWHSNVSNEDDKK